MAVCAQVHLTNENEQEKQIFKQYLIPLIHE
jgi:hypothetical protein